MRYYEIALPVRNNQGLPVARELQRWETEALALAGGYTVLHGSEGHWRDTNTGKVYIDTMRAYRVACEPEVFGELVLAAFMNFPDQVAIFTAEIGEAHILERPSLEPRKGDDQ